MGNKLSDKFLNRGCRRVFVSSVTLASSLLVTLAHAQSPVAATSTDNKAAAKVEPKAAVKVEPKATVKVEPKATVKVEPKATVKVEPKATAKVEPKATVKVEPKAEPKVTATPVVVAPPPVSQPAAAPVVDTGTEQARLVYEKAVAAYEEHRYSDAIDLFQQADVLRPNPAFSFNIGTAYEDMGDSAMALRHYRAYLRQLPKALDRDEVEGRLRRLEGVLADTGLQQVTILSSPSNATVILDDKPRGVTPWTGEVAPGAHVVTLKLQEYDHETRDFDLPSRRAIDVPVTLKKTEKVPAPLVDLNQKVAEEPKASWQYIRPVTWGVLGVGVASIGTALGFELTRAAVEERSQETENRERRLALHQDAQRSEMWAKSFLMFGLGMGVTAMVLGYQDIDDGLSNEREAFALGCSAWNDCGVTFSGSF